MCLVVAWLTNLRQSEKTVVWSAFTSNLPKQQVAVVAKATALPEIAVLCALGQDRPDTACSNVVRLYSWLQSNVAYAMELEWLYRDGPNDAKRCLADMLVALSHLHRHSVLHRDIKPSAIMYDVRTGAWKLVDFDCAVLLEDTSLRTAELRVPVKFGHKPVGTDGYIAPELLRPGGFYSSSSEVWALGNALRSKFTNLPNAISRLITSMTESSPDLRWTVDTIARELVDSQRPPCTNGKTKPRNPLQNIGNLRHEG